MQQAANVARMRGRFAAIKHVRRGSIINDLSIGVSVHGAIALSFGEGILLANADVELVAVDWCR